MNRRVVIIVSLLVLVAAGVALAYASPYMTVAKVRKAAARGDAETINAHVDFPALRQSVKGWMGASMAKEMAKPETSSNPFAVFGMAMAVTIADKFVDVMITPESVRMMLEGQRPQPGGKSDPEQEPQAASDTSIEMGYEAHDRFVVKAGKRGRPETEFAMVWLRSGLAWKLSALRLPTPSRSGR